MRLFRRAGDQRGIADCMIGLGCVRAGERRPAEAARLFGAAAEALEALCSAVWPSNRADYQHWERIARAAMGTHAWDDAWTSGRALGIETIVNDVLSTESMGAPPVNARAISGVDELTPRELHVAQLAARGLSNRRIGDTLVIAEKRPPIICKMRSTNWMCIRAARSPRVPLSWASHRHRQTSLRRTSMLAQARHPRHFYGRARQSNWRPLR